MKNVFLQGSHHIFRWEKLGNLETGRENLGPDMPVLVYRLLEYSMNHVLSEEYGVERANELFRMVGHLAGGEFAKNVLDLTKAPDAFISELQAKLKELRIGILRLEEFSDSGDITLTVAEDLDCSGLPPTGEVVCNYDEGFLAGVLDAYTGKTYHVREVDCWASGERFCRFKCQVL